MRSFLANAVVSTVVLPALTAATALWQQDIQTPLVSTGSTQPSIIHTDAVKPLLRLHQQLIAIESISGNEHDVGAYLVRYLHDIGLSVEIQKVDAGGGSKSIGSYEPFTLLTSPLDDDETYLTTSTSHKKKLPSRFNVFAYTNASTSNHHHTLLTTHIDTVPPYIPYSTNSTKRFHADTLISGRGSVDAKAALAAMLTAWTTLLTQPAEDQVLPADSTAMLLVVGEEVGGSGMRAASAHFAATEPPTTFDVGIFGEPTEHTLACGHKGNLGFHINVHGRAAHSGYPWLGVSANDVLIAALAALKFKVEWPSSEKYGNTTVNVGRIEGGFAANVVAERASAKIAIRIAQGQPEAVRQIVRDTIHEATEELLKDASGKTVGDVEVIFPDAGYGPIDCDCDLEGFETMTVNYGTDVPWLAGNHKSYLYGPGSILVAHSDHEALTVKELKRGVEDYKRILLGTL